MPYFITDDAEGCSGWATIKEDGEVIGCHNTKQDAIDQMVAVSIAEDIQVGGERKKKKKPMQYRALPENYRSALEDDVPEGRACGNCLFFNEAKQITEDGLRKAWCERWDDYAQGGFYCNAWQPKKGELRAPAPASDQIEGSDENKPGSAQGAGGAIDFDEKTETALRNKVSDHNDQMAEQEKPTWTRTTLGQLKAVYRRGSGAYSTSHRPGVSRAAWSMARVNAYLYLLRNGRPENPAYTTDFDLLPEGHPKSTRKFTFLGLEHRQVDFSVPDYIQENAAQGLRWHREGLSGSGLVERTVREAAAMARGEITENKVRRMAAWFARHMSDLSAPSAKPDHPDYPSPGVVAHALWGGGSRNQSERAMAWAEAKVKALDSEQRHASHDQLSHGSHRLSAYAQVADEQSNYRDSLSSEQTTAVDNYQSRGFISLNESLRSNTEINDADRQTMVQLDKTLANVPSFTSEKTFARGIDGEAKEKLFANAKPGDIISDSGFLSTTADETVAKNFTTSDGAKIIIKAPAGTKGFAMGDRAEKIITSESEVLFARKTKLKVLSINQSKNQITVEVQP